MEKFLKKYGLGQNPSPHYGQCPYFHPKMLPFVIVGWELNMTALKLVLPSFTCLQNEGGHSFKRRWYH